MPKYLTVQSYRNCDDYPLTSADTDLILARTIARAESDIDSALGFDLRLGGLEPHTAWVEFQWTRNTRRIRAPGFPVPLRRAIRYMIQVSNQSATGAPFVANIGVNDVAYNVFDFYVEIVPLTSIYSLVPALVALGLNPSIVQMDYEAGFYFGVVGETLIDSGDHLTYYASRGFWATSYTQALSIQPVTLPPITPVVYANGAVVQESGSAIINGFVINTGYTLNTTEGTVTFSQARSASDIITLDYTYTIPDNVRDATIYQTSFILGQRALNKIGMQGLDMMRMGEQILKRHPNVDMMNDNASVLCMLADNKLANYREVPVA